MLAIEAGVLRLQGALDADHVPALYRALRRAPELRSIDLAGVASVDSAGVAFVRWLQAQRQRGGQPRPELLNAPEHYLQLCRAHRVNGLGD